MKPLPNVQKSIQALRDRIAEVKAHCLCFSFLEHPTCFVIMLPEGYGIDAIRAHFGKGLSKVGCLDRILNRLETIWKNSFPSPK